MKCPECVMEQPQSVQAPNYCVYCGHALMAPCPYSDENNPHNVATVDSSGDAPAHCTTCGRPYRQCSGCRRLAVITGDRCGFCNGTDLREVGLAPWSCVQGSPEGTKEWSGRHAALRSGNAAQTMNLPGVVRAMAYRHGYLVAATDQMVVAYTVSSDQWKEQGRRIYPADTVISLAIEAGWVLLISQRYARAFRLPGLEEGFVRQGSPLIQVTRDAEWLFVDAESACLHRVKLGHDALASERKALPEPGVPVKDAAWSESGLAIATDENLWYMANGSSDWQWTQVPVDRAGWRRVVWGGQRLFAAGLIEGGICLVWFDADSEQSHSRNFTGDYLADVALCGSSMALLREHAIELYDASEPRQNGVEANLVGAWRPQGIGYVRRVAEEIEALLPVRTGRQYELQCVRLPGASGQRVGIMMSNLPVVCPAGDRLVVASAEGGATRIWTYVEE